MNRRPTFRFGPRKRRCGCSASALLLRDSKRLIVLFVLALLAIWFTTAPCQGQSPTLGEYDVKAAFLFHFAQFVEWPESSFKDSDASFNYCILGDDPFRGSLDAALKSKAIGTHPFRVSHLRGTQEISSCQLLFISDKKVWAGLQPLAEKFSILTVGDSEQFVQEGGMIGFLLEENKVRFEINLEASQRAKLKISSKLLALAKSVIGGQKVN